MGKPYSLQYHLAPHGPHVGTMQCAACRKPIDAKRDDFREAMKDTKGGHDWYFVTHHRQCLPDAAQEPFRAQERKNRDQRAYNHRLRNAAIAFRDQWLISDLDQLIEDLS